MIRKFNLLQRTTHSSVIVLINWLQRENPFLVSLLQYMKNIDGEGCLKKGAKTRKLCIWITPLIKFQQGQRIAISSLRLSSFSNTTEKVFLVHCCPFYWCWVFDLHYNPAWLEDTSDTFYGGWRSLAFRRRNRFCGLVMWLNKLAFFGEPCGQKELVARLYQSLNQHLLLSIIPLGEHIDHYSWE